MKCGYCLSESADPICADCVDNEISALKQDINLLKKKVDDVQTLLNRFGLQKVVAPA